LSEEDGCDKIVVVVVALGGLADDVCLWCHWNITSMGFSIGQSASNTGVEWHLKVSYLGDLPCAWICKQRCTADGIVAMSCRYGVAA
jgi:hypothetical protein